MDNRPIGVFDSGLGGLTTVRELRRLLPNEDIVYFGDTGRVPYGTRSPGIVRRYAGQDQRFLLSKGVKLLVVACNTAAAALAGSLAGWETPAVEVITPAAAAAARATRSGKIAVIGTPATIKSRAYETALHALNPELRVTAAACGLFVPLVENGFAFSGPRRDIIRRVAADYLAPVRAAGADTLILGCTHYPILRDILDEVMEGAARLIDSGAEAARAVERTLEAVDLRSCAKTPGFCRYFVSDSPAEFSQSAELILGERVSEPAVQVDIESY